MQIKILFLSCLAVLFFANSAESGGAVAKAKAKNTRPRVHVQIPKPRIHLTQQPVMEGSPTIHVTSPGVFTSPPAAEAPEPEHQSQVLSTAKPDLSVKPSAESSENIEEIVDLPQLLNSLRTSSQAWPLISDDEDKQVVVQEFIKKYQHQGVTINKTAAFYTNFIDEMSQRSPQMLNLPFERILQVATVMEYDFDNGQDKDAMAQKILGPDIYEKNKQRLSAQTANAQPEQQQGSNP